jgi:hypothetical protein
MCRMVGCENNENSLRASSEGVCRFGSENWRISHACYMAARSHGIELRNALCLVIPRKERRETYQAACDVDEADGCCCYFQRLAETLNGGVEGHGKCVAFMHLKSMCSWHHRKPRQGHLVSRRDATGLIRQTHPLLEDSRKPKHAGCLRVKAAHYAKHAR